MEYITQQNSQWISLQLNTNYLHKLWYMLVFLFKVRLGDTILQHFNLSVVTHNTNMYTKIMYSKSIVRLTQ